MLHICRQESATCELRYYFKKIHNQLEAGFNRKYKKYGLTSTQLDVLLYLFKNSHGENTLTDLAAHFNVKHTSVIHVQRILEKKELICKSAVSGTRSRPIRLTDRGEQLGRQIFSEMEQTSPLLDQVMFAGLSDADRQLLERMLQQIYENLTSDAFKNPDL